MRIIIVNHNHNHFCQFMKIGIVKFSDPTMGIWAGVILMQVTHS